MLFWAAGVRGLFAGGIRLWFRVFWRALLCGGWGLYGRLGCREKERILFAMPALRGAPGGLEERGPGKPLIQPSRDGQEGNRLPGLPHFMREQGGGCRAERGTFPDGLQLSGRRPPGEPLAQDLTLLTHAEY